MKEFAVGTAAALVLFLIWKGYNLLPLLLFGGLLLLLYRAVGLPFPSRRLPLGGMGALRSDILFDDVGGQETAKKELLEALEFVRRPERIRRLGIRPLKGILLTGPPGTGKTLLAKAAANDVGAAFLAAAGSEFVEMYAGVGAQRVRELFRRGRELAKRAEGRCAIIFIDEIEVLGGRRGQHQSHLEYDQTLNQLLVEMDGIQPESEEVRILVMAATNRPDMLDEALTRPGRFDRVVRVDLPDRAGRELILRIHTRNKPLAPDVDLGRLAQQAFGFSGAHLESLANEAAILALREKSETIAWKHFVEAIDKVMLGERLDRRPDAAERHRVAVHEAGHALVGEAVQPGSVASITITSRGQALGYVRQAPAADRYMYTSEQLIGEIRRCLAGAAAEEVALGGVSTGATGDFEQASQLARRMLEAGMTELGVVRYEQVPQVEAHRVLSRILEEQREWTRAYLAERQPLLERLASVLLESEQLHGETFRKLVAEAEAERAAGALADGA